MLGLGLVDQFKSAPHVSEIRPEGPTRLRAGVKLSGRGLALKAGPDSVSDSEQQLPSRRAEGRSLGKRSQDSRSSV